MDASPEQLDALFPTPRPSPPTDFAPDRHPGWDSESTETVLELLKDNHKRWHIFFNDMKFHNHASHHLLSIYAMGAKSTTLKAAYATHVAYMKPAFESPEPITKANWKDHLGDEQYYQSYVSFLSGILLSNSIQTVLEDYLMSKDANVVPGKDGKNPLMLSRFLGGFLHPLIHAGYGAEFGLPGLIAEGLAQAAVQDAEAVSLFPAEIFETGSTFPVSPSGVASRLASLVLSRSSPVVSEAGPHALSVLARIANDDALTPSALNLPIPEGEHDRAIERVVRLAGSKIAKYASEWTVGTTKDAFEAKFEEIVWMNTVIYAVGGWAGRSLGEDEKHAFNGDFFLMHLVTSSLLTSSVIGALTPASASLFLRTYFTFSLVLYVARGRPSLPIADFYKAATASPSGPGPRPHPVDKALPPADAPNPWLHIIESTLVHPNEHLCKLQRAVAHFASLYGGTPAGRFADVAKDGLTGAEVLDGTLFIRAAGLTADRLGWMREGEEERGWDNGGFFPSSS